MAWRTGFHRGRRRPVEDEAAEPDARLAQAARPASDAERVGWVCNVAGEVR